MAKKIVGFIKLQLPEGKKNLLSDMKQVFAKTVLKMLRAYGDTTLTIPNEPPYLIRIEE